MLCLFSSCGRPAAADPVDGLVAALATAPGIAPRLSVGAPFRRCTERVPPGGTIPRADCPAPRNAAPTPATLRGVAPRADDPRSVHLLALFDLSADDPRGIMLERTISSLRRVVELSDDPTGALVDLSATLIVRAEHTQAPRDLLEAYEAAQQAVDRDSTNAAALYNRALALDRFGLVEETAEDWRAAIAADSESEWADEARRRLDTLQAIRPPVPPRDDAPLADYARYAAEEPQGARELGMDRLLAEWGEAVVRGDTARAEDRLRRAEALGTALVRRPGGDASLADMVRTVRAAVADTAATRKLAEAHREYGVARRSYNALEYGRAQASLTTLAARFETSSVLRQWTQLYLGITRLQLGDDAGERLLKTVVGEGSSRYPALLGCARWAIGRTIGQRDRWESALGEMEASARDFRGAGESNYEAGATSIVADTRFIMGEPDSGYIALHRSLALIRPYRTSIQLHNLLVSGASAAATDGFRHQAVRFQEEGVAVASRAGHVLIEAEARLELTRQLAGDGKISRAAVELDTARILVHKIEEEHARAWFEADLRDAEGAVVLRSNPARASQAFDSAAAFFAAVPHPVRELPPRVGAAEARLAAGDAVGAIRRLEVAVRLLEQRRDSFRVEPRRAAVFDGARAVVDRIVMLKLAQGRTAEALDYMDRARAALAPAGGAGANRTPRGIQVPRGEVALEYARIADTLLVWAVVKDRVHLARTTIDTVTLARTVEDLTTRLERGAAEAELRPALSRLYNWLVRPVEAHLGEKDQQVAVVADGEIATVPFAALFDSLQQRYLVEDHPLRFAVSLRAGPPAPRDGPADGPLLVVADPAFDPRENPLLDRLSHAREEARNIAAHYPDTLVLQDEAATRAAVETALPNAEIVHFAGHAVFDDRRPERSYLVLASRGSADGGRLTAADLARLELGKVRLVVLSACQTVRGGKARASGFTGIAGALLAARAHGVVGSTWKVDDEMSAAVMLEFHRVYRSRGNGPLALHAAQLAMLHSRDVRRRTPSAWAAFRYAGN